MSLHDCCIGLSLSVLPSTLSRAMEFPEVTVFENSHLKAMYSNTPITAMRAELKIHTEVLNGNVKILLMKDKGGGRNRNPPLN